MLHHVGTVDPARLMYKREAKVKVKKTVARGLKVHLEQRFGQEFHKVDRPCAMLTADR